jgi:hypothetical protein
MRDERSCGADDRDWAQEMARARLGEFAGMSAEELADV